jgi:putative PIG3 family NAD(P)H quinone oxidoreductase
MLVVNPDTPLHHDLALEPEPDPVSGPRQVVIDVVGAGVNRADLLQVAGHYPPPPGAPAWPGLEVSGVVSEVGEGSCWRVGDEVVALVDGGGYATRVLVPDAQVLPAPPGVPLVDAAALPEAVCTVWSTLGAAHLATGEWLLVHGGSGGIGTIAIQLAAAMGAHVITTAGGQERAARCAALGAELALDHRTADVVADVRRVTQDGVDVVLDVLGAGALDRNLDSLADGGRLAVIGLQLGRVAELDLSRLMSRRLTVLGTTLRSRPPAQKAAIVAAVGEHVWPMVADGRVRPVVHDRVPLAEAGQAHRRLAAGEVFGSLVLVP